MKILITGAAGYIGSVVAEILEKQGHSLIIIDDLRDGNEKAVSQNSKFYKNNFGVVSVLEEIFSSNKIDIVFHFAASANVPHSKIEPLEYYENNTSNTIALLSAMHKYNVKKIIFSSTAAVFGEPQYSPIDEKHPLIPINPYGYSKLACEEILKDCSHAYGFKYVIFRYFCAAGATAEHGESRKHETHLIPVVLDTLLGKRNEVPVFGDDFNTVDGTGVRDYIHVVDIANAHIKGMENIDVCQNQIFNLGTGKGYSVLEVIKTTEELFSAQIKHTIYDRRPGDPATLVATFDKASNIIGWKPEFGLKEIIMSAYNWRKSPLF
jgi:UDP-glucose 4-epimerase